ncbi:ribosomal RNA large subunit methyltransferase F [Rhizoctonia solani AG-1 IB]|uniref:Ribosomal RNA large subunit methyltransferase F n=1 Tax=Thanatephorus cucumeris (strain AG1-IB / isolate 7/3/14) TaxID=1108050 RepID=A0A0B7FV46_THACB|nr:ribosomal RNA large subunit methyltransferase F [Rhizoctonia solani AG-1 IB]
MSVVPYETIDFGQLAAAFPPLKPFLFKSASGGYSLNFKDDAANRTLTRALLKRDFGLDVTLLEDRLCPPVPNRLNYVLWISELVNVLGLDEPIVGLDIGTGSTAIYPLLACSMHSTWLFIAADIDSRSLAAAQVNIEQNTGVRNRICLYPTTSDAPVLSALLPENLSRIGIQDARVTFSMCNPPFYSDMEEVNRSAESKEYDPHAVCTGALVEMITPGGEVAFVQRMIDESLSLRETCKWYTSLLGKMSSVTALVNSIKEKRIDNYAITELVQGTTRRWVVAWSFTDTRLPDTLARPKSSSLKSVAPLPNTLHHTTSQPTSHQSLIQVLRDVPKLQCQEQSTPEGVHVTVFEVTWTRAARRRVARSTPTPGQEQNQDVNPIMVCEARVTDAHTLEVQWIRGKDRSIFESFWGYVSKKLDAGVLAQ